MNKYCIIIQRESGHDECVAALVNSLNELGVYALVCMPADMISLRGNIFSAFHIFHHYLDDAFTATGFDLLKEQHLVNYVLPLISGQKDKQVIDLCLSLRAYVYSSVFFTTFETSDYVLSDRISELDYSIYGFIHNPAHSSNLERLLSIPNSNVVIFSQRMYSYALQFCPANRIHVFYLAAISKSSDIALYKAQRQPKQLILGVIGKVDFRFRDYNRVLQLAKFIKEQKLHDQVKILIIGGIGREGDGKIFQKKISDQKLDDIVEFPFWELSPSSLDMPFISYEKLLSMVDKCDYTLSCFPSSQEHQPKVSGVVNLSIDRAVPVLYFDQFTFYPEGNWSQSLNVETQFDFDLLALDELRDTQRNNLLEFKRQMELVNKDMLSGVIKNTEIY